MLVWLQIEGMKWCEKDGRVDRVVDMGSLGSGCQHFKLPMTDYEDRNLTHHRLHCKIPSPTTDEIQRMVVLSEAVYKVVSVKKKKN